MNRLYSLALTLFVFVSISKVQAQALTRNVLFLGNSYTSAHNLPQLTADAALSAGDILNFDSHVPGGYKLTQHATDVNSTSKIMAGGWDYVVLQEQSNTPALQNGNFSTGAQQLCKLVKQYNPCAQPLFYMTWGRKNGDALNCPLFPLMCTYNGMDSLTSTSYTMEAHQNNTEVSPVGAVWKYIRQNHPTIDLYHQDESHPSPEGSYAAACCFYTAIFKKDPLLISYNFSLNPADAAAIRNAVKVVFYNHLADWNFKVSPTADFNYTIGSGINEAIFNYLPSYPGTGPYSNTFFWDFGDGSNLTLNNPNYLSTVSHNYAANGTYTVTLIVSNCDVSGTQQATVQHTISFCNHNPTVLKTYSWTCAGSETLSTQPYTSYQWYTNGNIIPGQTGQHFPLNPLISQVSVLATQNGCSEMSPQYSYVTSPEILMYDVVATGSFVSPGTLCMGETLKLVTTSLNGAENIQWSKNGSPIPSATNDTLLVTSSGDYMVSLFYPNCPANIIYTTQVTYTFVNCGPPITTGIMDINDGASIAIYPNPSSGVITINHTGKMDAIEIFNLLGEKIYAESFVQQKASHEVNLSTCTRGIYFVKAYNGKSSSTKKIVLE